MLLSDVSAYFLRATSGCDASESKVRSCVLAMSFPVVLVRGLPTCCLMMTQSTDVSVYAFPHTGSSGKAVAKRCSGFLVLS